MTYKPSRLQRIALIACQALLFSLLALISAHAQNPSTVGPVSSTVTACNGTSQLYQVPDYGQSVHFVAYSTSGLTVSSGYVRVSLINAAVSSYPVISDTATDQAGGIITANGYYHNVAVDVVCGGGSSPSVTVTYFGTSSNAVPVTGAQDQSAWFKPIVYAVPENVTQNFGTVTSPYGNTCGVLYFVPNQGSNSGTLTVNAANNGTGMTIAAATFTISSAYATQAFNVPCQPAESVQFSYTQGTPNSGTYALYYAFYKPGLFPNLTTPNSGTSSTSSLQVISDALSQSFSLSTVTVNPGANAPLIGIQANSGSKTIYMDHATITSTAVAEQAALYVFASCTACSGATGTNLKAGSNVISQVVGTGTSPGFTLSTIGTIGVNSGSFSVIDLRGVIIPAGGTAGFEMENLSSITSTVYVTLYWYEKL